MFWITHVKQLMDNFRTKLHRSVSQKSTSVSMSQAFLSQLFALPISVATTLEASDWSVQLRPDAASLQSKEPLCRVVAATVVASVQWDPPTETERTTTVK